jgi:flagellar motor switch protein FliN/FliY
MTVDNGKRNLDLLMSVPLQVTAELGKCKMTVQEILKLGAGSVVELDRMAGGPVDLLVNNKLVARGEVVAIEDNFGVRVTEIIEKPQ